MIRNAYTLTPKRTEYGKRIRKKYEAGEIQEKRRNMTSLSIRGGGTCGTITTVEKDNYVLEDSMKRYRIRKLTENECFKLQGFTTADA